jgi:hypothetical protein
MIGRPFVHADRPHRLDTPGTDHPRRARLSELRRRDERRLAKAEIAEALTVRGDR